MSTYPGCVDFDWRAHYTRTQRRLIYRFEDLQELNRVVRGGVFSLFEIFFRTGSGLLDWTGIIGNQPFSVLQKAEICVAVADVGKDSVRARAAMESPGLAGFSSSNRLSKEMNTRIVYALGLLTVLGLSAPSARADWQIKTFRNGNAVNNLSDADALISGTAPIGTTNIAVADLLGENPGSGPGRFSVNNPVPGIPQNQTTANYAVQGTGFLVIPVAGNYTFALNTDDGGRLRIDGADVIVDNSQHGPSDSAYVTVNLRVGAHAIEWTWFNAGGGAEGEAFAAPGAYTGFDPAFQLIGSAPGLVVNASAYTNLIVNGSFESPTATNSSWLTINSGDTALSPWTVSLTSVDVVNSNWYGAQAFDGAQVLDLDGTPGPGQVTQSFPTAVGASYHVSFEFANSFIDQPSASASVRVYDAMGNSLGPTTITHSTSARGNLDWRSFNGDFVARGGMSSIELTSLSTGGNGGILIDAVTVIQTAVPFPPYITAQPSSVLVQSGSNATFSVSANGQAPMSYQWHFDGVDIPNGTNATLTLNSVGLGDMGFYSVTISNAAGSTNSVNAVLNVYVSVGGQGWAIRTFRDGSSVSGLADADRLITNTPPIATGVIQEADFLGFNSGEGTGHFSLNAPVPGITQGQATDNYAVQGTGFLLVPAAGTYTFGLSTDDGGRLRIDGATVIVDDVRSPPHDSLFVPVFLSAGVHSVEWTWYNEAGGVSGGGAEGEAFAAPGVHGTFDSTFRLLGDPNGLAVAQGALLGVGLQTLPPTDVTTSSADLRAALNPNGSSTSAHFEYGATIAYGKDSPSGDFGTTSQSIGFVLSGLLPGNTYHYRIVASNAAGVTLGNDMQFTTLPASTTATQAWVAGTSGLGLRLRDAPSLSATVILVMPEGASLTLLGDTQTADGYLWRHVAYSSQTGWAAAQYLVFSPGPTLPPPAPPVALHQLQADGTTPIAAGATINASSVILAATPSGASPQEFTIQFEVEPSGTAFSEPTVTTSPVSTGSEARATLSALANQSYHWRARVLDGNGVPSTWVTFSGNPTDFIIAAPASRLANFTYSPSQIFAGDTVTFTAEAAGQAGLTFNWDFGGGQTAAGGTATQAFAQSGDATVTLTVTDGQGGQAQKTQVVPVASKNLVDRINAVAGQSQSLLDDVLASAQKAANAADYFNQDVQSAPGDIEMTAALTAVSLAMGIGDNDLQLADRTVEWVRASYGNSAANRLALKLAGIVGGKEVIRQAFEDFVVKEALSVGTAGESPSQVWVLSLQSLVAQKRAEIEALRAQAVAASGSLTPAQSALLVNELQARLLGNIALRDSYAMNANLPITFHNLRSDDESGVTTYTIGQFVFSVSASLGAGTVGVMAGPVAAVAVEATQSELDIFNTLASQSAEAQLLGSSISAVAGGPAVVNRVTSNIESCLNLIIQAQTPAATPAGSFVAVTPFSVGKLWTDNLWIRWFTKEAYADITIQNTGSQDTTYRLEAFLTKTFVTGQLPIGYRGLGQRQYDIQTAVAVDGISLSPGRRTTQRLYFLSGDGGQVPEGQDIAYVLTAHTAAGYYRQDSQSHHFGTTYIDENGNVVDPAIIASASVVQNPLRVSLLVFPGTNLCQLGITVQNPVETPLLMTVGQDVPSGTAILNAGSAVISNNHLTWELDMQPGQMQFLQVTMQLPPSLNDPPLTNTTTSAYDSVGGAWLQFSQSPLVAQIVSSPPPQLQPLGFTNGSFGVNVQTLIPGIYRIDATSDLLQWSPVITVTNTAPTFNINDSAAASFPARFYRAVRQ